MSYRVDLSPEAQKELKALPGYVRAQALDLLRGLSQEPRPLRAKELSGHSGIYRIWLARKWRIAYDVDEDAQHVLVLRIRRKESIEYETLSEPEAEQ